MATVNLIKVADCVVVLLGVCIICFMPVAMSTDSHRHKIYRYITYMKVIALDTNDLKWIKTLIPGKNPTQHCFQPLFFGNNTEMDENIKQFSPTSTYGGAFKYGTPKLQSE